MREKDENLPCRIFAILVMLFLLAPLVVIVIASFTPTALITFPPQGFSLKWYANIFGSSTHFMDGLVNSLKIGILATAADILLGVTAALSVCRYSFKGKDALLNYYTSPMYVPSVAFAFVLLQVYSQIGGVSGMLRIFIGHLIIILPYIVRNTVSVLHVFNWTLEDAATSMGATPIQVFFKITIPLARALVTRPSILLLDEPLSNLDAKLRVEMQVEIKRIQKELGITTIIVTHDHEEAVSLADRVIVMNAGHILQIGKPQEVFDRPASPFISDFLGFSTFLHGIAAGAEGDMRLIRCGAHTLQVPAEAAQELTEGDACILAIRSENIRTAEQEGVNTVRGTVKSATYKGHTTRLEVSGCFEEMVYPAIHEYADVQEGSEVLLHFPAQHFCVYKDIK